MGLGEKIRSVEDNLNKLRILSKHGYFKGMAVEKDVSDLVSDFEDYHGNRRLSYNPDFCLLMELLDKNKEIYEKTNFDPVSFVDPFEYGEEKSSNVHYVKTKGEKYVFPDLF